MEVTDSKTPLCELARPAAADTKHNTDNQQPSRPDHIAIKPAKQVVITHRGGSRRWLGSWQQRLRGKARVDKFHMSGAQEPAMVTQATAPPKAHLNNNDCAAAAKSEHPSTVGVTSPWPSKVVIDSSEFDDVSISWKSIGILVKLTNLFGFSLVWNGQMSVCTQCIKLLIMQIAPIVTLMVEFVILFNKYTSQHNWNHHDNLMIFIRQLAIVLVLVSGLYLYRCQQQRTIERLCSSLSQCTNSQGQQRRSLRLMTSQLLLVLFTLSIAFLALIQKLHQVRGPTVVSRARLSVKSNAHYSDYVFAAASFWGACQIGVCVGLVAQGSLLLWAEINNFNDSIKELVRDGAFDALALENCSRIHAGLCRAVKVFNTPTAAHILCTCVLCSCILPSAVVVYQQVYSTHLQLQSIGWCLFAVAVMLEMLVVATFVHTQFHKTAEILQDAVTEMNEAQLKMYPSVQFVIERSEKVGLGFGPVTIIKRETVVLIFFIYGLYFGLLMVLISQSCDSNAVRIGGVL